MKSQLLTIFACFFTLFLVAQENNSDTTQIELGDDTKVLVIKKAKEGSEKKSKSSDVLSEVDDLLLHRYELNTKKPAYYSGVEVGVATMMGLEGEQLPQGAEDFNINPIKSLYWGFNFAQLWVPILKNQGIFTGIGVSIQSITFNELNLEPTLNDQNEFLLVENNPHEDLIKRKMRVSYVHAPLMLSFNTSKYKKRNFHVGIGGTAYYKLSSMYKEKYKENGKVKKDKKTQDYSFNPFRIDASVRIGYGNFTLFANYAVTPMFREGKAPEMGLFTAGVQLVSW